MFCHVTPLEPVSTLRSALANLHHLRYSALTTTLSAQEILWAVCVLFCQRFALLSPSLTLFSTC